MSEAYDGPQVVGMDLHRRRSVLVRMTSDGRKLETAHITTFIDPRLCAAIVDRLTFAGQIIETGTTSYRLAHARKRRAAS